VSGGNWSAPAIDKRFAVLFAVLIAALALRFVAEVICLLPSPVGDSGFFITASANYCGSGFLGTTAYQIDPTGQSRMVWHGFVSTMLFGAAGASCGARSYYFVLWMLQAATLGAVLVLARLRGYSVAATAGLALFALAAQTACGFRPETLAILLVVLAEIALARSWYLVLGALAGTLLCTQPTVAGIYALSTLILRPELLKRSLPIGAAAALTTAALLALYPFPVADLVEGIRLQAVRLVGRSDGSVLSYYLLNTSLPGWGLLFLASVAAAVRRTPWFLLMVPVLWFFGPRVPPVFYNLVPPSVMLIAVIFERSPAVANWIGILGAGVALLGLGFVNTRDLMTAYRYGDTFVATSVRVATLAREGRTFDSFPPLLALTNPELRLTDPRVHPRYSSAAAPGGLNIFAVNGMPRPPCPSESPAETAVSLPIGKKILFNSNSGWMIYVCESSADQSEAMPATRHTRLGADPSQRRTR
jgi:hypothetical protein